MTGIYQVDMNLISSNITPVQNKYCISIKQSYPILGPITILYKFPTQSKHLKAKNQQGPVWTKNMPLFSSSDLDDDNDADNDDGTDDDDDDADFLGINNVRQWTGGSQRLAWTFLGLINASAVYRNDDDKNKLSYVYFSHT